MKSWAVMLSMATVFSLGGIPVHADHHEGGGKAAQEKSTQGTTNKAEPGTKGETKKTTTEQEGAATAEPHDGHETHEGSHEEGMEEGSH